uniref:Uncharacterized protein n=1 Tax=Oryza sativa subsp. indica TaxID=39946 RepID=A0A679BA06_ORYSI|nr:hypothetical protein [Oryza sativa Indica Group]
MLTAMISDAAPVGGGAAGGQRGRGDGGRSGVQAPPLAATHEAHEAAAGEELRAGGDARLAAGLPEDRAIARGAAGRQSKRAAGRRVAREEDGTDRKRDGESEDVAAVVVHGRRSRASALNSVAGGSVTATGDAVGRRASRPVRAAAGGVVTELDRPSPFSRQGTCKRDGHRCRHDPRLFRWLELKLKRAQSPKGTASTSVSVSCGRGDDGGGQRQRPHRRSWRLWWQRVRGTAAHAPLLPARPALLLPPPPMPAACAQLASCFPAVRCPHRPRFAVDRLSLSQVAVAAVAASFSCVVLTGPPRREGGSEREMRKERRGGER